MSAREPVVLALLPFYLPGFDAAGPNQSFRALARDLQGEVRFRVVAVDPARRVASEWSDDGDALTRQLPAGVVSAHGLRTILRRADHDLLLLGSFFDYRLTIPALIWRRLGLIPRRPTILSPRGEFAAGALSLKSGRKRAWLALVRALGLTGDIWFHATADHERADIARLHLPCRGILEAPDTALLPEAPEGYDAARAPGPLRLIFLGRIVPVKNIEFAVEVLARVNCPVEFHLFGPLEDPDYWARCEARMADLPDHVRILRHDPVRHDAVAATLLGHDLLFLPSLGENFGHVVHEALSAGRPVLISDATPWRHLSDAGAGWDLPLDDPAAFAAVIDRLAASDAAEVKRWRRGARHLAEARHAQANASQRMRALLHQVIKGGRDDLA